jgi:hypothetical protein
MALTAMALSSRCCPESGSDDRMDGIFAKYRAQNHAAVDTVTSLCDVASSGFDAVVS